jgi:hypothetical protein
MLRLELQIEASALRVRLQNPTDDPVRVWQLGNSWGGAAWSVQLATLDGARIFTLRPSNRGYTRNLPRFIEVPAHGQAEVELAPSRPEWTAGEDLSPLKSTPVSVRAVLEIEPTPESERLHVACGRVESEPEVSQPPHSWLFAGSTENA